MDSPSRQRWSLLFLAVTVEGALALLAWAFGWFLNQPPLSDWRWSVRDGLVGVAASLPLLGLLLLLLRWPIGPLRHIERLSHEVLGPIFAVCSLGELLLIAGLAGVGEEMFFRGFLQGVLARSLGIWPGLVFASVVFGVLHWLTPTYAVLATLMGAYLGAIWLWTDNLLVPVIAHGLYDLIALVTLTRRRAPTAQEETEQLENMPPEAL